MLVQVAGVGGMLEGLGDPHGQVIEQYLTEDEETSVMVEVEELTRLED